MTGQSISVVTWSLALNLLLMETYLFTFVTMFLLQGSWICWMTSTTETSPTCEAPKQFRLLSSQCWLLFSVVGGFGSVTANKLLVILRLFYWNLVEEPQPQQSDTSPWCWSPAWSHVAVDDILSQVYRRGYVHHSSTCSTSEVIQQVFSWVEI